MTKTKLFVELSQKEEAIVSGGLVGVKTKVKKKKQTVITKIEELTLVSGDVIASERAIVLDGSGDINLTLSNVEN